MVRHPEDQYNTQIKNLNDLAFIYKRVLLESYNMEGYITITQEHGNWDSSSPKLPVLLMAQDYVTVFQDEMGNQGSDTTVLVKNVFNLRYDIWESFIRDAML